MVTILDNQQTDLVRNPPAPATLLAAEGTARLRLALNVVETDERLPVQALSARLDWNDGGPVSSFAGAGSLAILDQRDLRVGTYVIRLQAHNHALPRPAEAVLNLALEVRAPDPQATPRAALIGPVLPRDQGFPGPQDWLFHSRTDLGVLESSLKMLLTTAKGERLMEPGYGTNLRRILFDANIQAVESVLQEEIDEAVARWEPRVELTQLSLQRHTDTRSATVNLSFTSKLNGRGLELVLPFTAHE